MACPGRSLSIANATGLFRWLLSGALALGGCALAGGEPVACAGSPLCDYELSRPAARWLLPAALDEASGLVALSAATLLTHNDNDSTIWRLRLGDDLDARPVSDPATVIGGDFEGVTLAGNRLLALSSRGRVYRSSLSADGVPGPLAPIATGIDGRCNFEGIAAATESVVFLACKYPVDPRPGSIRLYRLSYPGTDDAAPAVEVVEVDVAPLLDALGLARLRPSGLAWLEAGARLLVVAGKERVLLDVDLQTGTLIAWRRLSKRLHRQAEGVTRLPGGALAIVDEADGRVGTLTVYARRDR